MMKDPGSEVRWQAAIALGEIGSHEAVAPLLRGLEDPDKFVRVTGLPSRFSRMATSRRVMLNGHGITLPCRTGNSYGPWSRTPSPPFLTSSGIPTAMSRVHAVQVLGDIGNREAGPALIRSLGDADRRVRWEATLASQKCGVPPMYLPGGYARGRAYRKTRW